MAKVAKRAALSFAGPPGCGKGTLFKFIVEPFCRKAGVRAILIPTSDEIRLYRDEHPEESDGIMRDMKAGRLVEDGISNQALINGASKVIDGLRAEDFNGDCLFVLDGSPRTLGQINTSVFTMMSILNVAPPEYMTVFFTTPHYLCGHRIHGRGREDDLDEDAFITRWEQYFGKTEPAIKTLKNSAKDLGIEYREIDGQLSKKSVNLYQRILFNKMWPEYFRG
ncbi:MAG: nucleoside monophosphate kinase [bacterium]